MHPESKHTTSAWRAETRVAGAKLRSHLTAIAGRWKNTIGPALKSLTTRSKVSMLLILAGMGLLAYVAVQYGSMFRAQRELQAQWERQQARATLVTSNRGELASEPALTRLEIPKINLDAVVVEGDSSKELLLGPGHIVQTAFPGETGNAVITGHRDTFFRHIFELSKGDEIVVERNGQKFRYAVTGKRVVQPEDISVLNQTQDAELTLITCYPTYYVGPAPERLVVFSKLQETPRN